MVMGQGAPLHIRKLCISDSSVQVSLPSLGVTEMCHDWQRIVRSMGTCYPRSNSWSRGQCAHECTDSDVYQSNTTASHPRCNWPIKQQQTSNKLEVLMLGDSPLINIHYSMRLIICRYLIFNAANNLLKLIIYIH